ncbi:hypothetical protein JCM14076_20450 [Methylosoma difficile]
MSQDNLGVFFMPAVAGLFFFMKRPKVEVIETLQPVYTVHPSGLTGVERYLQSKIVVLQDQIASECADSESLPILTGVAKYLAEAEQHKVSGVSKYLLKLSLAEKQKKHEIIVVQKTGVEKYLSNVKPLPKVTGVAKYIKHQESLPKPSKVERYLAKQALASKYAPATSERASLGLQVTGVAKYLLNQESQPKPSRVARYVAKQAAMAALQGKQAVPEKKLTGVAKYLEVQDSLPKPSRVSRYIAKQAASVVTEQKAAVKLTGVAKYLQEQDALPKTSRVSKYLTRQALAEKKNILIETGVDKYVRQFG